MCEAKGQRAAPSLGTVSAQGGEGSPRRAAAKRWMPCACVPGAGVHPGTPVRIVCQGRAAVHRLIHVGLCWGGSQRPGAPLHGLWGLGQSVPAVPCPICLLQACSSSRSTPTHTCHVRAPASATPGTAHLHGRAVLLPTALQASPSTLQLHNPGSGLGRNQDGRWL